MAYMYADDLALTVFNRQPNFLNNKLTHTSSIIHEWCNANCLKLNYEKTVDLNIITCHRDLSVNNSIKFLGIYLEPTLGWSSHINYLAGKLSKSLFILRVLKEYLNVEALMSVYYAHVYSHLSYAIILWGNHSTSSRLFVLQKKCVRLICGAQYRSHCKPLFVRLNVLTLPSMYVMDCLLYVKKNILDLTTRASIHYYSTRNNSDICLDKCKFSSTQKSFDYMSKKLYNSIPLTIF